jgi:hypothetical protein
MVQHPLQAPVCRGHLRKELGYNVVLDTAHSILAGTMSTQKTSMRPLKNFVENVPSSGRLSPKILWASK